MALGNGGNHSSSTGNNQQQMYNPTYYSRLRFRNPVDNLALSFSYWNGTLRIAISESGSPQDGRTNELGYIHLSPTKARLFSNCVEKVINDPETLDIYGIDTGIGETRGLIAIGRDMGKPYLVIARVNNSGEYESNQRFNFNVDYHNILQITNLEKLSFKKEIDNNVELNQFRDLLDDYARSASGAFGASIYDIGRYESAKSSNMIRRIASKVGAIDGNYNGNKSASNNSFFNSADAEYTNSSSGSATSPNVGKKTSVYQSISSLEDEFE